MLILNLICYLTIFVPVAFVMGSKTVMPNWLAISFVVWSVFAMWSGVHVLARVVKGFKNRGLLLSALLGFESAILMLIGAISILTIISWSYY